MTDIKVGSRVRIQSKVNDHWWANGVVGVVKSISRMSSRQYFIMFDNPRVSATGRTLNNWSCTEEQLTILQFSEAQILKEYSID